MTFNAFPFSRLRGFDVSDSELGYGRLIFVNERQTVAIFDEAGRRALPTPDFLTVLELSGGGWLLEAIASRTADRTLDLVELDWEAARRHRTPPCWSCGADLDNDRDPECPTCGWILCPECGACEQRECRPGRRYRRARLRFWR